MFEEKVNKIKKLSEIEMIYFEFSNCLYSRENKEILNKEVENFEKNFDTLVQKNNFNLEKIKNDKNLVIKRYEKVISSFLDTVETLFVNVLETLLSTETNQNIIMIKKTTIEDVKEMMSTTNSEEDLEMLMKTISSLNMSVDNLDYKILMCIEKIKSYEEIIDVCKKEIEVCYYTREKELEELRKNKFNFQTQIKSNVFNKKEIEYKNMQEFINEYNKYLDNLELNIIAQLNDNIFNYIDKFNFRTDELQNKINSGGANNV